MDIKELRHMIKHATSVLVLDGGEPAFVIVDYAAYKKMTEGGGTAPQTPVPSGHYAASARPTVDPREVEILDRLNKEIAAIKAQIEVQERTLESSQEALGSYEKDHVDYP